MGVSFPREAGVSGWEYPGGAGGTGHTLGTAQSSASHRTALDPAGGNKVASDKPVCQAHNRTRKVNNAGHVASTHGDSLRSQSPPPHRFPLRRPQAPEVGEDKVSVPLR